MTTKISTLPTLTTVTDATIIPVVEGGSTKRITGLALKTYTGTSSGPQGPQGPSGSAGASGPSGPSGPSGASASVSSATSVALGTVYGKTDTANLVFVGYQAGNSNTSGTQNTAVGIGALQSNVSTSYSTAIGYQALNVNTGGQNTAVGRQALYLSTGTSGSTAIGVNALYSSTYGGGNVAVGDTAAFGNTTGSGNVAIGNAALYNNATSSYTVAVGNQAMYNSNGGLYNTAVGYRALFTQDSYGGESNTAIGYSALLQAKGAAGGIAQSNTAVGSWAGQALTGVGNNNSTLIGAYAGYLATSGSANTLIGASSGYYITTGSKNTVLGRYNGNQNSLDIRTASNNIVLSDGDGYPRVYWDSQGLARTYNGDGVYASGTVIGTGFQTAGVALVLYVGTAPSTLGGVSYQTNQLINTGVYEFAGFGGPAYSGSGPGYTVAYCVFSVDYNNIFSIISSNLRVSGDLGNSASITTGSNYISFFTQNQAYQNYPRLTYRRIGFNYS